MAEAFFTYQLGTLRPQDAEGRELLEGLKNGDLVRVNVKRPRNVKFHRFYWALITKLHENMPEEKRERYPTPELLSAWFKIATGHCEAFKIEGKGMVYIPLSISFAKMDQVEFSRFFNRCCNLIAQHFIPDVTPETWHREVEHMIGIAA